MAVEVRVDAITKSGTSGAEANECLNVGKVDNAVDNMRIGGVVESNWS